MNPLRVVEDTAHSTWISIERFSQNLKKLSVKLSSNFTKLAEVLLSSRGQRYSLSCSWHTHTLTQTHTHTYIYIYVKKKAVSTLLNRLNCSEILLPSSHRSKPPLSKPIMESHSGDSLLIGESSSNSVSDVLQHF